MVMVAASTLAAVMPAMGEPADSPPPGTVSWRYYNTFNTGVQGDWNEALYVGPDGDPWIGGYDPSWEQGGIARYVQAEDRWVNLSNVDYRILGHPENLGTVRVQDIVADRRGVLWFPSWTAVFSYDPALGASSLRRYDLDGPRGVDGGATDAEAAPDGTVWVGRGRAVGVDRFNPSTRRWTHWDVNAQRLAIQPKPTGGYYVWAEYHDSFLSGSVSRYDTATGAWTDMPAQGGRGQIFILQQKDAVDGAGNVWAYDIGDDVFNDPLTLGYLRPDGVWVEVPTPWPLGQLNECAGFKAYGNGRAICGSSGGTVFNWNGTSWIDLGIGGGDASAIAAVDIDVATGAVWTAGAGGAARRDPVSGRWQRYRITNTSQGDNFVLDVSLAPNGDVWTTANVATGIGGFQSFDGVRWHAFNQYTYGLPGSGPYPFNADSSTAVTFRPSNGHVAVAVPGIPFPGAPGGQVMEWTGSEYIALASDFPNEPTQMIEDGLGRLWVNGFFVGFYDGTSWNRVAWADEGMGAVGDMALDPDDPSKVWLLTDLEVVRTDGTNHEVLSGAVFGNACGPLFGACFSNVGIALAGEGTAWVQSIAGLSLVDIVQGTITPLRPSVVVPLGTAWPIAVSPDGLLWYSCDPNLCWINPGDPSQRGIFYAPPNGGPQWGGLPHAVIDAEFRPIPGGYELWLATLSRGIAVLEVTGVP